MSTLRVNNIQNSSGGTNTSLGKVVNVIQTIDSSATLLSGAGYKSYTGLNTTVTPLKSNSKFLITFNIKISMYQYSARVAMYVNNNVVLSRESNTSNFRSSSHSIYNIAANNLSPATIYGYDGQYLYTHSGSGDVNITFETYAGDANGLYVNRSWGFDDVFRGRPSSFLTVMEIAQ